MKLICDGLELSDAVLRVVKAVSTKSTNPLLECIKLKAKEDYLLLSATDTELSIEKKIRAEIKIEGETLVAGRLFADFVKKLSNEQIEINNTDNGMLKISYMDSEGKLASLSAEDFPVFAQINNSESFTIGACHFKEAVSKVSFAAATEDTRPILKGVLLEINENILTTVALDGYRLAKCTKTVKNVTSNNLKAIVPARTLSEIIKFIGDGEEDITIYTEKNHIMVNIDNTVIISRLLAGEFINYKLIIPNEFSSTVTLEKKLFENSLERASILSKSDKNNLVKLDVKEKLMTITSNSEDGNIKENIAVNLNGKDMLIAFNAKYLSEAVKNLSSEYLSINFTSSVTPCVILPSGSEEFLYLILPVRIISWYL